MTMFDDILCIDSFELGVQYMLASKCVHFFKYLMRFWSWQLLDMVESLNNIYSDKLSNVLNLSRYFLNCKTEPHKKY